MLRSAKHAFARSLALARRGLALAVGPCARAARSERCPKVQCRRHADPVHRVTWVRTCSAVSHGRDRAGAGVVLRGLAMLRGISARGARSAAAQQRGGARRRRRALTCDESTGEDASRPGWTRACVLARCVLTRARAHTYVFLLYRSSQRTVYRSKPTWRGVAWRGVAWRGVAWRGVAWCWLL